MAICDNVKQFLDSIWLHVCWHFHLHSHTVEPLYTIGEWSFIDGWPYLRGSIINRYLPFELCIILFPHRKNPFPYHFHISRMKFKPVPSRGQLALWRCKQWVGLAIAGGHFVLMGIIWGWKSVAFGWSREVAMKQGSYVLIWMVMHSEPWWVAALDWVAAHQRWPLRGVPLYATKKWMP